MPLLPINRTFRQKINKDILDLKNTVSEMDLTDINTVLCPTAADDTFFSVATELSTKYITS
jgi:hypothetical protein